MRKSLLTLSLILCCKFLVEGQAGLHIAHFFDGSFGNSPDVTEVIVNGEEAKKKHFLLYRCLTLSDEKCRSAKIDDAVFRDGVQAQFKEVEYRDGKIYCGFYQLPPFWILGQRPHGIKHRYFRYIFYLNEQLASQPRDRISLFYIESDMNASYVKGMLTK